MSSFSFFSAWSHGSIISVGSICSIGSVMSNFSVFSVLSTNSYMSLLCNGRAYCINGFSWDDYQTTWNTWVLDWG